VGRISDTRSSYDFTMRSFPVVLCLLSGLAVADTKYELKGNELVVPTPVLYESGKATLKPESADAITHVKGYLDAKSYISTLRIEVHSDADGSSEFNQKLTEQRAMAVAKALVAKGVDCKRLLPVGFGSSKPIADNKTKEGRAENRRVELKVVE